MGDNAIKSSLYRKEGLIKNVMSCFGFGFEVISDPG